ncbi:MAG: TRAP transporter large permease [Alphaproteobacteria bacterium]|nr:TRAP transporter large permease [Alphaproteobacteria bacterium]
MSDSLIGLAGFGLALLLVLLRVPVAVAMGVVGAAGFAYLNGWPALAFVMGSAPFEATNPYTLSVVPLFIAMGVFATHAGLSTSLFRAVHAFVGHFRGGLAMAAIGACAGFGAICGSSLATAATMGRVALPEMRRHGYADSLATASIAAGGTLGVLIPPSILLVIYALLTEQSIGALFLAAVFPGLLGTALYMAAVSARLRLDPTLADKAERLPWAARARIAAGVWPVLGLFVVVVGGIYVGLFSPTEAAAVGAVGAFLMALVRRALDRATFRACLLETAQLTAMIFLILIGAGLFNYFIETTGLPQFLVAQVEGVGLTPFGVILILMAFYIVLGCFMDALSMILLTVPFVFPLVTSLGIDPIWFGVLLVTVAELGLITPPVGMNLFVIMGVARDVSLGTVSRGVVPFLLADVVRLALLIAFPAIALWLPASGG